ncbi:MAG: hypothetical protein AAGA77_10760 [Bacteroidota bacterium]
MKTILKSFLCILLLASSFSSNAQKTEDQASNAAMLYFAQDLPGKTPAVFAPGVISKPDRYEFGCTISGDGTEFYFGVDNNGKMETHRTVLINGKWSRQENIFPNEPYGYNDPMFTPDEKRLFFISNRPTKSNKNKQDIDIWYIERTNGDWSEPINAGSEINNNLDQYYSSFTADGSLYYGSRMPDEKNLGYSFDIYKSPFVDGQFTTPIKLPQEINTDRYEADVFVAPDESYMVFCSIRPEGFGRGDLYISFKDENGNWKKAVHMDKSINTKGHELCPFVTKDGKYFFYTSNEDIYWVSSDIFEAYRNR